ncbi:MAG: tRNA (N(6)-L-threonylcarbamoyladenosine(37)-C(2))-methylthiotransferase MtaB [Oscillospiraceae bacterium]|nr:tRNA (N(6)-L-threonylcarbamoyladenosine(37)-C(2))-methylthiotransferase MtaB [Oscillospiraceae bacterium]
MLKVFYITFGCKVNSYETECIKSIMKKEGFEKASEYKTADIVILNSCTVTASGDSRMISAFNKIKRENPNAITVITGCYPQAFPEDAKKLKADIITGTKNKHQIPEMILEFLTNQKNAVKIDSYNKNDLYDNMTCCEFPDNTRAFIKIQDGCNCFCSYCIIPYARGRCRSKSIDVLKKEVTKIAENGIKEIVLAGINLAFYGKEYNFTLADAVEICCSIDKIERVRLGSLEPEMITDEQLQRFAMQEKFCPQFHLSLQSGCNRTLKAMNRKYTAEEYAKLVQRIRNVFPICNITTDIMVGFPQETDEDFNESLKFAESINFGKIHVFRYSRRKGTVADKMNGQISENIKSYRWHKMNETASESQKNFLKSRIGMTLPVLFEREKDTDFHNGYTPDYTYVKIPEKNFKKSLRNSIFYVKIISSTSDFCIGEIVDKQTIK